MRLRGAALREGKGLKRHNGMVGALGKSRAAIELVIATGKTNRKKITIQDGTVW